MGSSNGFTRNWKALTSKASSMYLGSPVTKIKRGRLPHTGSWRSLSLILSFRAIDMPSMPLVEMPKNRISGDSPVSSMAFSNAWPVENSLTWQCMPCFCTRLRIRLRIWHSSSQIAIFNFPTSLIYFIGRIAQKPFKML